MHRLLWICLAAFCAAGCGEVSLPPPPQHTEPPHVVKEILDMTGGRPAETWGTIDSGIHAAFDPHADWRWAAERSVFHFRLDEFKGWTLAVRLSTAKTVLDAKGPQHVYFDVNGTRVGAATLDAAQGYRFALPIDEATLRKASPVAVTMDAGPCLPQQYGPPYCILLHTIGFTK